MLRRSNSLAALLALFAVASLLYPALAHEEFLEHLRKIYTLPDAINSCHLCHHYDEAKNQKPRGYNMNDYGSDLANQPQMNKLTDAEKGHVYTEDEWKVFEASVRHAENDDSDGDGATNIEEITLGTFPGDKSSVPDAEALKKLREKKKEK